MQSLCTLRNHCRQWSRNTRYQADATPYLDRTCTGRIAPAWLAHLFDHLIGPDKERWRDFKTQCLRSGQVDHQLYLCKLHDGQISWLNPPENFAGINTHLAVCIGKALAVAD